MDATSTYDASSSPVSLDSNGSESIKISSGSDTIRDFESPGEIIRRFELEIACICEKLTNLNLLSMHVETKESAFEALVSDMEPHLVIKGLEIDLLSGLLDSEVKVIEKHISDLQNEKCNVKEFLSSLKHSGEPLMRMEDMLDESGRTLEQSLEQVLEIKVRSANFQRNLLRFSGEEAWKDKDDSLNDSDLLELQEKMKMQNVEHQRHILKMLEKSWEREMDLEKRVSELSEIKESLTKSLHFSKQELVYTQEEAEITLEKFYEADYKSNLLIETSKSLLNEIKILQFNLKGSFHQEAESRNALLNLKEHTTERELQAVDEKQVMENTIKDLRDQIIKIVNAESKYSEELKNAAERIVSLETEVSDTNFKLQHMEACYEASLEEKSMLLSTIKDMGNVIDDLKKKVSKSQSETESVEDKCIILSESNTELKKELGFVRRRVKTLEESLFRMEETKNATAKDIDLLTKLITDLVMQMALERERLQKETSSLKHENKSLVKRVKKTEGSPAVKVSTTKSDLTIVTRIAKEGAISVSNRSEPNRGSLAFQTVEGSMSGTLQIDDLYSVFFTDFAKLNTDLVKLITDFKHLNVVNWKNQSAIGFNQLAVAIFYYERE